LDEPGRHPAQQVERTRAELRLAPVAREVLGQLVEPRRTSAGRSLYFVESPAFISFRGSLTRSVRSFGHIPRIRARSAPAWRSLYFVESPAFISFRGSLTRSVRSFGHIPRIRARSVPAWRSFGRLADQRCDRAAVLDELEPDLVEIGAVVG